jgi:hypothetical protein
MYKYYFVGISRDQYRHAIHNSFQLVSICHEPDIYILYRKKLFLTIHDILFIMYFNCMYLNEIIYMLSIVHIFYSYL